MKKYNFFSKILIVSIFITTAFLFCPEGEPAGTEPGREPGMEKLSGEVKDAYSKVEDTKKKFEDAQEERGEEDKDTQRKELEYQKARVQLKETLVAEAKDQGKDSIFDPEKKEDRSVKDVQAEQKEIQAKIRQLSEKLGETYEPPAIEPEKFSIDQTVGDLTKIVREKDPTLKDATQAREISEIQNSFDVSFNIDAMNEKIKQAKSIDDKQKIIDDFRNKIDYVDKMIDQERENIKDKPVSEEYEQALATFKESIDAKMEALDAQAIEVDAQQIGFFEGLAKQFRSWFDRTFDFHKKTAEKRSIDDELTAIKEKEKMIKPITNLFKDIENIEFRAGVQIESINYTIENEIIPKKGLEREFGIKRLDNQLKNIDVLTKSIDDFEKKVGSQKEQINKAYDDLVSLNNDLFAKSKRYIEDKKKHPSLFEKMREDFANEVAPAFGPNELYEALGLDPTKEITQQEIIDADVNMAETLPEGSDEYLAARNAAVILRNPADRVNYDAFLKDWNALESKGIDPRKISDTARKQILNTGEVAKLEITKDLHERIMKTLGDLAQTTALDPGAQHQELSDRLNNVNKTLESKKQQVESLKETLQKELKKLPPPPL